MRPYNKPIIILVTLIVLGLRHRGHHVQLFGIGSTTVAPQVEEEQEPYRSCDLNGAGDK